jgi:hypothetical protein
VEAGTTTKTMETIITVVAAEITTILTIIITGVEVTAKAIIATKVVDTNRTRINSNTTNQLIKLTK